MYLQNLIITTLTNDAQLSPNPFPGGVWARIPQKGEGASATPGAFWGAENPLESGKLKNTIAVIDSGDVPTPEGAARNGFTGFPLVYGYVAMGPGGTSALTTLEDRLHFWFNRHRSYPTASGGGIELVVLERQPIRDADDFGYPGRQFAVWRLQGTYVRP